MQSENLKQIDIPMSLLFYNPSVMEGCIDVLFSENKDILVGMYLPEAYEEISEIVNCWCQG